MIPPDTSPAATARPAAKNLVGILHDRGGGREPRGRAKCEAVDGLRREISDYVNCERRRLQHRRPDECSVRFPTDHPIVATMLVSTPTTAVAMPPTQAASANSSAERPSSAALLHGRRSVISLSPAVRTGDLRNPTEHSSLTNVGPERTDGNGLSTAPVTRCGAGIIPVPRGPYVGDRRLLGLSCGQPARLGPPRRRTGNSERRMANSRRPSSSVRHGRYVAGFRCLQQPHDPGRLANITFPLAI